MSLPLGKPGGVTSCQLPPRKSCTRPLDMPIQIIPDSTGDGAMEWIDPPRANCAASLSLASVNSSSPGSGEWPLAGFLTSAGCCGEEPKSWLTTFQVRAPSEVFSKNCEP